VLVILACVAGLGLGIRVGIPAITEKPSIGFLERHPLMTGERKHLDVEVDASRYRAEVVTADYETMSILQIETFEGDRDQKGATYVPEVGVWIPANTPRAGLAELNGEIYSMSALVEGSAVGSTVWYTRYGEWSSSAGLSATVGAFVDGSANLLRAIGVPIGVAVALMGVLVASFAGTTLDTACRLQRYVVQELAGTLVRPPYKAADGVGGLEDHDGPPRRPPITSAALYGRSWNPLRWLTNKHGATVFAIVIAAAIAAMPAPAPGSDPAAVAWTWDTAGKGGLILWPMFGATNQLLGGLAFLVIVFWLRRRSKPIWFAVLPLAFMLVMPAWAMLIQVPGWLEAERKNWALIFIAVATLALEAWMIVEAVRLFPRVRGVAEADASRGQATG
jgi:carbon starvation protein CstA